MKILPSSLIIIISIIIISGCTGKSQRKRDLASEVDTVTVPDTGYTGIKQYFSNQHLLKEITFENGVRHGLMKTYYQGGQLYQTFWYENGLREDSAAWYYLEGQVFRTTPYKHDTIDGIQKQYYRTGKIKAKIGYNKGLRTPLLEEYDQNGRLFKDYPEIVTDITDEYSTKGTYRIGLEMSDKTEKVKFCQGEFANGRFDTTQIKRLETVNGKASLELRKTGESKKAYTGIIAEIVTLFGNRHLIYKKIDLPYNDLN